MKSGIRDLSRFPRACGFILYSLALVLLPLLSSAAITNLASVTFLGTTPLTSTNTGGFDSVSGQVCTTAVGPRDFGDTTAASLGWSGVLYSTTNQSAGNIAGNFILTNGWTQAQSNGCVSGWFWFEPNNNRPETRLLKVVDQSGNIDGELQTATNYLISGGNEGEVTLQPIPSYTWLWLAMSWHKNNPFNENYDFQYWCMTNGQSTPTLIHATTNHNGPVSLMCEATVCNEPAAATARVDGRLGYVQLATFGDNSDVGVGPLGFMTEPPETNNIAWYVNPATGNDTNSGVAPDEAWQTIPKVNHEAQSAGVLASTCYPTGPILYFDTSGAPNDISETNLTLSAKGLNVFAAPGNCFWTNTLDHVLTNSAFIKTAGYQNLWQTTDTDTNIVMWEDEKWMNHPNGSTITAVGYLLDGTPGSFWTDGRRLYVHPFGDTDPTGDGKRYTRSVNRGFGGLDFAINLSGQDMNFEDCYAGKTCMALASDSDSIGAYVVGTQGALLGTNLIKHCRLFYGSKHILGAVADCWNSQLTVDDVICDQGSPYFSQTPFVSFAALATDTNNLHIYHNCQCPHFEGLIGSTAGNPASGDAFYSHNSSPGTSNQFNLIKIDCCNFYNNYIEAAPAVLSLMVSNSTYGGGVFTSPHKVVTGCHLIGNLPSNADHTETMVVKDCEIDYTNSFDLESEAFRGMAGTNLWTGNNIVATPPGGDDHEGGLFLETDTVNLGFSNNVVVMQGRGLFTIFEDFSTNDLLALGDNLYVLTNNMAHNYRGAGGMADLSFPEWQAGGFDAGSVDAAASLESAATVFLFGNSWAVGVGTNPVAGAALSVQDDGTNVPFQVVCDPAASGSIFRFNISPSPGSVAETYTVDWLDDTTNLQLDLDPEFLLQPSGESAFAGCDAIFCAQAIHATGYQWQENGTNLVEDGHFTGTTSSTLTIVDVQTNDTGCYTVVATHPTSPLTSAAALLRVFFPLQLGLSPLPDQPGYLLTVSDVDGSAISSDRVGKIQLYSACDLGLDASNWVQSTNPPLLTNGVIQIDDCDETNMTRFWRVVEQP